MEQLLRRTWAEIDLDALAYNFHTLQNRVGSGVKVLGVVKADAYGHGARVLSRELEALGAGYLAVSNLDEAREIRKAGVNMPILILGYTPPENTALLIQNHITQAVVSEEAAQEYSTAAQACGGTLKIHIKADTGMSRLGFLCADGHFDCAVETIRRVCQLPNLEAEGIFTHFAVSDEPEKEDCVAFTQQQFHLFTSLIDALETHGCKFALRHCGNSGATVNYCDQMKLDMVRPGIILYGCSEGAEKLGLKPVMTLKTTISSIKVMDPGCTVSYGRLFHVEKPTRIGVMPIGYADGFFRALSNRCQVVTEDGPVPQRGRICMDMSMIDLTDAPHVKVGSEVEVFGKNNSVNKLADIAGTISYELTCAVSKRVPRVFMKDGKVVDTELRMYL